MAVIQAIVMNLEVAENMACNRCGFLRGDKSKWLTYS